MTAEQGSEAGSRLLDVQRYTAWMMRKQSSRAPVVNLVRQKRFFQWLDFPFASVSLMVVLLSLFALSMSLGGWSWSSWTYGFGIMITIPLVAFEIKRKAVITGGAAFLLIVTVIIDAGLPRYFGYSPSDLSWYDLTAHYLGAFVLTLFLWAFICWTLSPTGPPSTNGRKKFYTVVIMMILVSIVFEFLEFITDELFGWTNFHIGVDTLGDLIFDLAGVLTAAIVIVRHRVSAIKRPFWHAESVAA